MKAKIIISLLFLLLKPSFANTQASHFEIYGFGLATDISSLQKRFPSSRHGATDSAGKYIYSYSPEVVGANGKQRARVIDETYSHEKAISYQIWFSNNEVSYGIGYIEFGITAGNVKGLRIVFEKPDTYLKHQPKSWEEGHYLRHAPCSPILNDVIKMYGQPQKGIDEYSEERLSYKKRRWFNNGEELKLKCYQLDGKGQELTEDIVITNTKK